MSAKLVIEYIIEKQGLTLTTLVDKDFSQISWLNEREPITNAKGERVSKSYYYNNTKEAIRIVYSKIVGDYTYNDVVYNDVYLGVSKTIHWIDWAGEIGKTKDLQPYYFTLEPVTLGDGTETIVSFSSPKMRSMMKTERYNADDYLQSKSPALYALIYAYYKEQYTSYLTTGDSTDLVTALNDETNEDILAVLTKEVYGYEPLTIKELIINNLQ